MLGIIMVVHIPTTAQELVLFTNSWLHIFYEKGCGEMQIQRNMATLFCAQQNAYPFPCMFMVSYATSNLQFACNIFSHCSQFFSSKKT